MEVLLNVIKNIFCVNEFQDKCNKCSLCHLIDLNNLPSLRIIEPDGQFIKKDQILELKHLFSKDSLYTKESIYIIKNAERMNKDSANTMLKFLEEPTSNVIGFFITNEKDNVMLTIQSRCQIIEVDFENDDNETLNLTKDEYNYYLDLTKTYLENIEMEKKKLILYNKEYLSDLDKDKITIILKIMLKKYQELLEAKVKNKTLTGDFAFLNKLSYNNVKGKLDLLIECLKEITYNVNLELFLDKFVLKVDEINNEII